MATTKKALAIQKQKRVTFIQTWIEALRSGTYKQGRGSLAEENPETGVMEYCCLGVACDLATKQGILQKLPQKKGDRLEFGKKGDTHTSFLPRALRNFLGFTSASGELFVKRVSMSAMYGKKKKTYYSVDTTLARLNDDGETFKEIAKRIENAAKPSSQAGLFNEGAL